MKVNPHFTSHIKINLKDGSAVKSIYFFKRTWVWFPIFTQVSQPSLTLVPGDLAPSLASMGTRNIGVV